MKQFQIFFTVPISGEFRQWDREKYIQKFSECMAVVLSKEMLRDYLAGDGVMISCNLNSTKEKELINAEVKLGVKVKGYLLEVVEQQRRAFTCLMEFAMTSALFKLGVSELEDFAVVCEKKGGEE